LKKDLSLSNSKTKYTLKVKDDGSLESSAKAEIKHIYWWSDDNKCRGL